ncbi:MAG: ribosome-associated translation inhibitor RaiA [Nitrosomonadales bacterium]|nr:ribosome-associated translation inhibitor RaiA [Nitrosomonadales bacterium]
MKINITGHHLEITNGINDHIHNKIKKIKGHADYILEVKVILSVDNITHNAEANIHLPKTTLHAKCSSNDMYKSIDLLINKLDKQIIKHKEKMTDHHPLDNPKRANFSNEN